MIIRDTDEVPLRSAPALCLLFADSLEAATFLRGGACFEEIALDVTQAGLAMALHSAPIEVGLSHPEPPSDVGARRVAGRTSPRCAANCWPSSARLRRPCRSPSSGSGRRPASPSAGACGAGPRSRGPRPLTTGR